MLFAHIIAVLLTLVLMLGIVSTLISVYYYSDISHPIFNPKQVSKPKRKLDIASIFEEDIIEQGEID